MSNYIFNHIKVIQVLYPKPFIDILLNILCLIGNGYKIIDGEIYYDNKLLKEEYSEELTKFEIYDKYQKEILDILSYSIESAKRFNFIEEKPIEELQKEVLKRYYNKLDTFYNDNYNILDHSFILPWKTVRYIIEHRFNHSILDLEFSNIKCSILKDISIKLLKVFLNSIQFYIQDDNYKKYLEHTDNYSCVIATDKDNKTSLITEAHALKIRLFEIENRIKGLLND